MTKDTTWIITLEEDPETGDLVLPLSDDIIHAAGLEIGDELTWNIDPDNQSVTLTKKVK
jgi:hypothetical protein